jgi:hypothetical protein
MRAAGAFAMLATIVRLNIRKFKSLFKKAKAFDKSSPQCQNEQRVSGGVH